MGTLLPTDNQFVEKIAMAMGRDRLYREASELMETAIGIKLEDINDVDNRFDAEFDLLLSSEALRAVAKCARTGLRPVNENIAQFTGTCSKGQCGLCKR